jgi:hypothetical protein
VEVLPNSRLSDHATVVTHLTVSLENGSLGPVLVLLYSNIPRHNLAKADQEDWPRYSHLLSQSDREVRAIDLYLGKRFALLISCMEEAVGQKSSL